MPTTAIRWRGGWILQGTGTLQPGAVGPFERVYGLDPYHMPVEIDTDSSVTLSVAQIIQQWESSSGNLFMPLAYTEATRDQALAARGLDPIVATIALLPLPKIYGGAGGGDATSLQGIPINPVAPTIGQALVYDGAQWEGGGWNKGPRLVVGNSLAGDTVNTCDFLDVGDGVQLQAALTAAGVSAQDVWVRPGTYTLAAAPLTVPSFVTCRGAGWGSVTIQLTATQRRAFIVGSTGTVENFFISVPVPAIGAAGTEIIEIANGATLRQVESFMAVQNAGQAANESLTAGVRCVAADAGVLCDHVFMTMISKRALGIAADVAGFEIQSRLASSTSTLTACRVTTADIGFDLQGAVAIYGWHFNGVGRAAVRMGASNGVGAQRMGPIVGSGFVRLLSIAALPQFGVLIDTGSDAAGMIGAKVADVSFFTTSVTATSACISMQGIGIGASVTNCSSDSFPIGVDVGATQTFARASDMTIRGATTPTQDASGSAIFPNSQVF